MVTVSRCEEALCSESVRAFSRAFNWPPSGIDATNITTKFSDTFHFSEIPFTLDSSETPERHAPETMAGGVAVFDYDNDGNLDIFFTNGADISSLQKTSPKYWNRLFRNNGDGTFTDVTEKAGLKGTGFDTGVAAGDFDNDGYKDIFIGGVHRNSLFHNNGDGTFTDITERAGLTKADKEYGALCQPAEPGLT